MATRLSRRSILAIGVAAALPRAASGSRLCDLIGKHQAAVAALDDICSRLDAAEDEFGKSNPVAPILIAWEVPRRQAGAPQGLCVAHPHAAYAGLKIRQYCDDWRRIVSSLDVEVRRAIDKAERQGLHRAAQARMQWLARREALGIAQLENTRDALDRTETELALEVLGYHCRTIEEARMKVRYTSQTGSIRDNLSEEKFIDALLMSFTEKPMA